MHAPALYIVVACTCHAPTYAPFVIANAQALYAMLAVFGACYHCMCGNSFTIPHAPSLSVACAQPPPSPALPGSHRRGTPLRACHFYVCLFLPFLFLTWSPQSREVFKSKMMRSFTLSPVLPSLSFDPYLIWATWWLRGWHKAAHTGTSDHFCGTPKCNWWGESALVWR